MGCHDACGTSRISVSPFTIASRQDAHPVRHSVSARAGGDRRDDLYASGRAGRNFHAGEAGVDLFFLLSGFLMIAITGPTTRPSTFMADRLRRIVPICWIVTSVMVAGAVIGLFPNLMLRLGHVVASYLFIPSMSPNLGQPWPVLVPGWTLNYEMLFSVVFALTLPLKSQFRQMVVLTILFALLCAVRLFHDPSGAIGLAYTNPILLEFVAGGWIGYMWKTEGPWPRWLGLWTTLSMPALILIVGHLGFPVHRAVAFGIPAAILFASILAIERRRPIGRFPVPLFLGNASYSIYVWHGIAISIMVRAGERLRLPSDMIFLLAVLGGVAAGTLGYILIERPILKAFARRRAGRGMCTPA